MTAPLPDEGCWEGAQDVLGDGLLLKRVLQGGSSERCLGGSVLSIRHQARVPRHEFPVNTASIRFGQDGACDPPFPSELVSAALWTMFQGERAVFWIDALLTRDFPSEPLWTEGGYQWVEEGYEWEVEVLRLSYTPLARDSKLVLQGGLHMPRLGLGLYMVSPADAYRATMEALQAGYRLIDTASMYQNEAAVGQALRDSGISASDVFVVTKVNNPDHGYWEALNSVQRSRAQLGLDVIDLVLIHSPLGGKNLQTWDALLEARKRGWVRQVGVSNFGMHHLRELEAAGRQPPAANQFELSPFCQEVDLRRFCSERGIAVMGYSPLTRGERLGDPRVMAIARKHCASPAQVLIRWALQHGVASIPKSTRRERLQENLLSFEFELDSSDLAGLACCEERLHTCWDCLHVPWEG